MYWILKNGVLIEVSEFEIKALSALTMHRLNPISATDAGGVITFR